jgi:hypothetical protein
MLQKQAFQKEQELEIFKDKVECTRDANAEKFAYSPPKQFKPQEVVTSRSTF